MYTHVHSVWNDITTEGCLKCDSASSCFTHLQGLLCKHEVRVHMGYHTNDKQSSKIDASLAEFAASHHVNLYAHCCASRLNTVPC